MNEPSILQSSMTTFKTMTAVAAAFAMSAASVIAQEDDETPLAKEMSGTSSALKSLRKIAKDDYIGGAAAARTAHEHFLKGMTYTASMIEDMDPGLDKAKALADQRRINGLAYAALCELEIAYLAKDDAAIKAATTKIKEIKKEGHEKYEDS